MKFGKLIKESIARNQRLSIYILIMVFKREHRSLAIEKHISKYFPIENRNNLINVSSEVENFTKMPIYVILNENATKQEIPDDIALSLLNLYFTSNNSKPKMFSVINSFILDKKHIDNLDLIDLWITFNKKFS